MQSGEYISDFRLLCSNGKSYTLESFSESKNLVFLFLTGDKANNKKSIDNLKTISSKYTSQDVSFIVINQHLNDDFVETDTSNSSNFIYLIDYKDNLFTSNIINSNEPVIVITNKERQLFFQEELIIHSKSYHEFFSKGLNELLDKSNLKIEAAKEKSNQIVDKTTVDKNYGLAINVVNLDDHNFIKQHISKDEKVLLYFWSTKWDVSTFELADLNFTSHALKSVGIKLVPINVDGKRNLKKVWLTLFENSCHGEHYISEVGIKDDKFTAFNNMIGFNNKTNFVLLSNEGEMLFLENKIVSLIEMRKTIITALKKKQKFDFVEPQQIATYSN